MADGRYTRYHLSARGEHVLTTVCRDCGSWAVDTSKHDEFHESLDRLWRTAEALGLPAIGGY